MEGWKSNTQKQSKKKTTTGSSSSARDPSQDFHGGTEKKFRKFQNLVELYNLHKGTLEAQRLASEIVQTKLDQQEKEEEPISPKWYSEESKALHDQFLSFWGSIGDDKKKEILEVRVQDLRDHLMKTANSSQFGDSLMRHFEEAIKHGRKSQSVNCWEILVCPRCDHSFTDSDSQEQHVQEFHKEVAPVQRIDQYTAIWANKITTRELKPVDVPKARKLLDDQPENLSADDLWKLPFPLCVDEERSTMLGMIQFAFNLLVQKKYIDLTDLTFLMCYAAKEVQSTIPLLSRREKLLKEIAKSHLSICLLDASKLSKIIRFLQSLYDACLAILEIPNQEDYFDNVILKLLGNEVEERISFSQDKSCLILDEDIITSPWAFLEWPFRGPSIGDEIDRWTSLKSKRRSLLRIYEKGYKGYEAMLKNRLREIYDNIVDQKLEYQNFEYILLNKTWSELGLDSASTSSSSADMGIPSKQNLNRGRSQRKWFDSSNVGISFEMKRTAFKFRQLSCLDYRLLLLPLVKSFLQDTYMLSAGQEEDVNPKSPPMETKEDADADADTPSQFASNIQPSKIN